MRYAIAVALFCFASVGHAETFTFTAIGAGFSASGTLTGVVDPYNAQAFDIGSGMATINGTSATLYTPSGDSEHVQTVDFTGSGPYGGYNYDDVVYTSGLALDADGLLFTVGTNHVNLYVNNGAYLNTDDYHPNGSPNTFVLTQVTPEPTSLMLVATGTMLAGAARRRFVCRDNG